MAVSKFRSVYFRGYDFDSLPSGSLEFDATNQNPIPAEVARMTVNRDTRETLLHRAAHMGYVESIRIRIYYMNIFLPI